MRALEFIKNVREVCEKNLSELEKPFYGEKRAPGLKGVLFITKTLSSRSIHGGAGDRDEDQFICVTKDGWIKYEIEVETSAIHEPFKVTETYSKKFEDTDLENYLNSKDCSIGEVSQFIKNYNELSGKFGLTKIDIFLDN